VGVFGYILPPEHCDYSEISKKKRKKTLDPIPKTNPLTVFNVSTTIVSTCGHLSLSTTSATLCTTCGFNPNTLITSSTLVVSPNVSTNNIVLFENGVILDKIASIGDIDICDEMVKKEFGSF